MGAQLKTAYQSQVHQGLIYSDPAQLLALDQLAVIQTYLHNTATRGKHPLASLFRNPSKTKPKGLYIWGGVGTGKSMLMDMFFATTEIERKRRVHFHAFMQEIHRTIFKTRQMGSGDPIKVVAATIARQVRVLCFDELHINDITDAMIVGRLFEQLLKAGVIIVTTSNRPPNELYQDGLNRQLFLPFIALIEDKMTLHHLHSPTDYRQDRLAGRQTYFHPLNAASAIKIEAIWTSLVSDNAGPLDLNMGARLVRLNRYHNGVARASFTELCARPLGPADFLAIAAALRVLILEDIPLMSRLNTNEAKRFVTLIDALYEAKVRLICSAAGLPETLYQAGAGAFEFARTASRLREMQSATWPQARPSLS